MDTQDHEHIQRTFDLLAEVSFLSKETHRNALSTVEQLNRATKYVQDELSKLPNKIADNVQEQLHQAVRKETKKLYGSFEDAIKSAEQAERTYRSATRFFTWKIWLLISGIISSFFIICGATLWIMHGLDLIQVYMPIKEYACVDNRNNNVTCITYKGHKLIIPAN